MHQTCEKLNRPSTMTELIWAVHFDWDILAQIRVLVKVSCSRSICWWCRCGRWCHLLLWMRLLMRFLMLVLLQLILFTYLLLWNVVHVVVVDVDALCCYLCSCIGRANLDSFSHQKYDWMKSRVRSAKQKKKWNGLTWKKSNRPGNRNASEMKGSNPGCWLWQSWVVSRVSKMNDKIPSSTPGPSMQSLKMCHQIQWRKTTIMAHTEKNDLLISSKIY